MVRYQDYKKYEAGVTIKYGDEVSPGAEAPKPDATKPDAPKPPEAKKKQ
jgi:hypothetical protein